ncbi:hypothetical protein TTRE_0000353601 [Trichuris trichiura]|uniref:ShKT domain-containing protein n=1 Tax=Trichuris trichiura TaxID=36087 RepID=A0A077Z630_TRITR|nr:hypothetical protein TTRE_0000353601 [Trichuris trichiura]
MLSAPSGKGPNAMCSWQPLLFLMLCSYAVRCDDINASSPSQQVSQDSKNDTILNLLEKLDALMTIFDVKAFPAHSSGKSDIDPQKAAEHLVLPQQSENSISASVPESSKPVDVRADAPSLPQNVNSSVEQNRDGIGLKMESSESEMIERLLSDDGNAWTKPTDPSGTVASKASEETQNYRSESSERQPVGPIRSVENMTADGSEGSSESYNEDNRNFRAIMPSSRSTPARTGDSSSGEIIEEEEEIYRLVNQKFKSEVLHGSEREAFMRKLCAGCWKIRKYRVSSPSPTIITTANKEAMPEIATIPPRLVEESVTIAQGNNFSQPAIDQATNSWPSGTLSTQAISSELGLTFEAKQFETNVTSPIFLANGRSENIPAALVHQEQYNPVAEVAKTNTTEHSASGTDVVPLTKTEEVDRGENALATKTATAGILNEDAKEMQIPVSEGSLAQPTSADAGVSVGNSNLSEKLAVSLPETTSFAFRNVTFVGDTQLTLGSLASPKEGEMVGMTINNEGGRSTGVDGTHLSKQEPANGATANFDTQTLAETAHVPIASGISSSGESPAAFVPEVKEQEMRRPDVGTTVSIFQPNVIEESYSVEEDSPLVSSSMGNFFLPDSPISSGATAHLTQTEAQPLLDPHNTAGTATPPSLSSGNNFDVSGQQFTQIKEQIINGNPSSLDNSGTGSPNDAKIDQPQLMTTTFNLPTTADSALTSTESIDGFAPNNSSLVSGTDLLGSGAQRVESGGGPSAIPEADEAKILTSLRQPESSDGSGNVTNLENPIFNASSQIVVEGSGQSIHSDVTTKPTLQGASSQKGETFANPDAADIMLSLLEPSRTSTAVSSYNVRFTDHPNLSTPTLGNNTQNGTAGSTGISNSSEAGRFDFSPLLTTPTRSLTENDVNFEEIRSTIGFTDASQTFGRSDVTEVSPTNEIFKQIVNSSDNLLVQRNQLNNGPIGNAIEGTATPSLSHATILPSFGHQTANELSNNEVISNNGNLENSTLLLPSLDAEASTVSGSSSVGLNMLANNKQGPTTDVITGNVVESEKTNSISSLQQPSLNWSSTTALPQAAGEQRNINASKRTIVSSPSAEPERGTNGNEIEEQNFNVPTLPVIATSAQHSTGSLRVPQQETNQSGNVTHSAESAPLSPSMTLNPETGNPVFWIPSGQPSTGQTVSVAHSSKAHLQSFSNLYRPGAVSRRIISDRYHKVNWNNVLRQLGFFNPEKLESAINGDKTLPAITEPPKGAVTVPNTVDKEIGDNLIGISDKSSSPDATFATFPTTTTTDRNGLQRLTPLVTNPREHDVLTAATATANGAAIMTSPTSLTQQHIHTGTAATPTTTTTASKSSKATTVASISSGNELGFKGPTTSPELDDVAETVDDVIDELRLANSFSRPEVFPFDTFTGKTPHLCGTELHPLLAIFKLLKRRGIYKLYKSTQCEIDYHVHCKYSWKYCDSFEALTFCPKTCRDTNCTRLKQYGYNEVETPVYLTQCVDTKAHDCPALSGRGDCFTNPHSMAFLCPDSCKFCAIDEEYLPFMPEAEKLVIWLQTYRNGHYKAYAEYVHSRVVLLHAKAKKGIC